MTACYTVAIRHARIDGLHAVAIAAFVSLLVYLPVYLGHDRKLLNRLLMEFKCWFTTLLGYHM